jgi:hypothetical protein
VLNKKQRQRNLENISFVRSLLKQKQETDARKQARAVQSSMEDSQDADSGEG